MTMTGGSVTVNNDESHTGSGLALAAYVALKAQYAADLPVIDPAEPAFTKGIKQESRLARLRDLAKQANALGPAFVAYLQANATVSLANVKAKVDTATSVGRLPPTFISGDPIDAPSEDVELPVTGDAGATTLALQ
jgi:hypothetical protein